MENPIGKPLKKQFRMELAKLREMDFKAKAAYIWEYYKIHLIAICLIFVAIGSLLNHFVFNPPPSSALFIAWSSGFIQDEQMNYLSSRLTEHIVDEDVNEIVEISMFVTGGDPSMEMASVQRLVAMIAAGTIDVFILDSQLLKEYSENGFIQPMDDILAEIRLTNPTAFNRIEEGITLVLYEYDEGYSSERIMGIDLSNSPLISELDVFAQELYFSIAVTSGKIENIPYALMTLFE